jgi:hypothetical protein
MSRGRKIVSIEDRESTADEIEQEAGEAAEAATPEEETTADHDDWVEDDWAEEPVRRSAWGWLAPIFFILLAAGWTGFFAYAHQAEMLAGASFVQWTDWAADWALPMVLITTLWLLAMRHSRRETARFADAARALSVESGLLETRLTTINRELSLAREFIAAQSRDLESLGRIASERLSENADRLRGLIHDNGAQVNAIASVSTTALDNMNRLRDELPVIANSARDVTSQIGNAGRTAHDNVEELVRAFERLNHFGQATGREIAALQGKVDAALTAFEAQGEKMADIATARFAALDERSEEFRAQLDSREVEALAAMRRRVETLVGDLDQAHRGLVEREEEALVALAGRIDALKNDSSLVAASLAEGQDHAATKWREAIEGLQERLKEAIGEVTQVDSSAMENARKRLAAIKDEAARVDDVMLERLTAFEEQVAQRRNATERREAEAIEQVSVQLAGLDETIAERQQTHLAHVEAMASRGDAVAAKLAELDAEMGRIVGRGSEYEEKLASIIASLGSSASENHRMLEASGQQVNELTDACVRLLEIIRSSADHTRDDLPAAIAEAEARLGAVEQRGRELSGLIGTARTDSEKLSEYVIMARGEGQATMEELRALRSEVETSHAERIAQLGGLREELREIDTDSSALTENARMRLVNAIESLRNAAQAAFESLDAGASTRLAAISEKIAKESAEAMDGVLDASAGEAIGRIRSASEEAARTSRETMRQLRDQLARVDELAGNLESRVARAREQAEEQVDGDFSRRVALITESLNSQSIDLTKALSTEVTDTAWASYLRGDRGIFTRRAVRLLDRQEMRDIAELYEGDADFREHVNRYIHDFEAMLRTMLSTRDGQSLAVTMLSSDMGKLYVALAQAIDRLRA